MVLDSTDARALAEFYRQLLGFVYRPGDEPSADGRGLTIDTKSADRRSMKQVAAICSSPRATVGVGR
ncbi:VOC family protein [Micromonospora gifhornensis]|uniref:VOC family protein n=1 Tax=Micromonospora gifhornensis TaxID=84594 RepID=UPI001EF1760F|nr:VOC family protein [Micromonospora gifhornensis]